uniref:Uncharacterized protein n=1 Tax=Physcomitrium patens TaxID=3218 RepID=A0A2K1J8M9_PHYPA|nr:hypothetical protein PHYPA_021010 [Physcomitrium patens]
MNSLPIMLGMVSATAAATRRAADLQRKSHWKMPEPVRIFKWVPTESCASPTDCVRISTAALCGTFEAFG